MPDDWRPSGTIKKIHHQFACRQMIVRVPSYHTCEMMEPVAKRENECSDVDDVLCDL